MSLLQVVSLFLIAVAVGVVKGRIVHNNRNSYVESEAEILTHSLGNPKFFDPKLANEFQILQPENIRESYENSFPDLSYVRTNGTYIIYPPSNLIISNNDVVNIFFYTSTPNSSDWIGAYSPATDTATLATEVPVKFGWCDVAYGDSYYVDKGDGKYGKGFLTFNFTNLRANISFVYFANSLKHAVVVNRSDFVVDFSNYNQPLRPRVVATGNPNQYNLLWSSYNSARPTVKWGSSKGKYTNIVQASTSEIPESEMCGSPANTIGWRELGLIHTAILNGMTSFSGKKIYYIFGDEATNDYSNEITLNVAPAAGDSIDASGRGTRVILFDDLGRGSRDMTYTWNEYGRPSIRTAEMVGAEIAAGTVDAVYHGGDISYATGYTAVWDFYENMMAPVTQAAVYLTTVGNHESDWPNSASYWNETDSGGECGKLATLLYPQPAPSVTNKPWWSYDVGLIHFVGMSTEHNFTTGSEQWLWLKNDLESVDRSVTPWVIYGGHRAMYLNSYYCCSQSTYSDPIQACGGLEGCSPTSDIAVMYLMVQHIEPLLYKNNVKFAFYGHNHVVQRQSAVLNFTVVQRSVKKTFSDPALFAGYESNFYNDPNATIHFVIGTGGATFTKNAIYPSNQYFPKWNEVYFYEYGYARVEAVNESYLTYEWILNTDGSVLDRVVIYQEPMTKSSSSDPSSSSDSLTNTDIILISVLVPVAFLVGVYVFYKFRKSPKDDSSKNYFEDTESPLKKKEENFN